MSSPATLANSKFSRRQLTCLSATSELVHPICCVRESTFLGSAVGVLPGSRAFSASEPTTARMPTAAMKPRKALPTLFTQSGLFACADASSTEGDRVAVAFCTRTRSEEHTSELQSL